MTTAALILGGGRARRLGGADKASVDIDGVPLIDHAYAAVAGSAPVVAVGPRSLARPGVTVVREDPPFGGPVAALAAGIAAMRSDVGEAWLLSCDLPRAGELVAALGAVTTPAECDGVIAVDDDGEPQWLAGRYRIAALRTALASLDSQGGASMRRLLGPLRLWRVDVGERAIDLDTWDAIEHYRRNRKDNDDRHP